MSTNTYRANEADIIRVFVVTLMAVCNAMALYTLDYEGLMTSDNIYLGEARGAFKIVPLFSEMREFFRSFRMPVFTFLAGYTFALIDSRKQYSLFNLLKDKFLRLLIPAATMITVILFLIVETSAYNWLIRDSVIPFTESFAYLWFLPMLFWNFLLGFIYLRLFSSNRWLACGFVLAVIAISFIHRSLPYTLMITRAAFYAPFFILGVIAWQKRKWFLERNLNFGILCLILFLTIYYFSDYHFDVPFIRDFYIRTDGRYIVYGERFFELLMHFFAVLTVYILALRYAETFKIGSGWRNLTKYAYTEYLIGLTVLFLLYKKTDLIFTLNPYLFSLTALSLMFLTTWLIVNIFSKFKLGRILIGQH